MVSQIPRSNSLTSLITSFTQSVDLQLAQEKPREEFLMNGNLRALSIPSSGVIWVSGSSGNVYRTENHGARWQSCPIQEDIDFRSLYAFNEKEACAASAGYSEEGQAVIYRTENGGASWKEVLKITEPKFFISGMKFWDTENGIILCDPVNGYFRFYITNNGGRSWQLLTQNAHLASLEGEGAFAASNTCMTLQGDSEIWFVTGGGTKARIFHSEDKGMTWDVYETPMEKRGSFSGIFSIAFRDSLNGIAVGGDYENPEVFSQPNILITKDGGKTWDPMWDAHLANLCLFCAVWTNEDRSIAIVE